MDGISAVAQPLGCLGCPRGTPQCLALTPPPLEMQLSAGVQPWKQQVQLSRCHPHG